MLQAPVTRKERAKRLEQRATLPAPRVCVLLLLLLLVLMMLSVRVYVCCGSREGERVVGLDAGVVYDRVARFSDLYIYIYIYVCAKEPARRRC